jgi:hypothetical protein
MTLKPNTSGFLEEPIAAFSYSLMRSTDEMDLPDLLEPNRCRDKFGETGEDTLEEVSTSST